MARETKGGSGDLVSELGTLNRVTVGKIWVKGLGFKGFGTTMGLSRDHPAREFHEGGLHQGRYSVPL